MEKVAWIVSCSRFLCVSPSILRSRPSPVDSCHPDILALKHVSRIFGHCNNLALPFCPVCGCGISSCSALKYWLENEKQEVLGCWNVRKFYCHALGRGSLVSSLLPSASLDLYEWSSIADPKPNSLIWSKSTHSFLGSSVTPSHRHGLLTSWTGTLSTFDRIKWITKKTVGSVLQLWLDYFRMRQI